MGFYCQLELLYWGRAFFFRETVVKNMTRLLLPVRPRTKAMNKNDSHDSQVIIYLFFFGGGWCLRQQEPVRGASAS